MPHDMSWDSKSCSSLYCYDQLITAYNRELQCLSAAAIIEMIRVSLYCIILATDTRNNLVLLLESWMREGQQAVGALLLRTTLTTPPVGGIRGASVVMNCLMACALTDRP